MKPTLTLVFVVLCLSSCTEGEKSPATTDRLAPSKTADAPPDSASLAERLSKPPTATEQISQYIRRMFQDREGNIWFGSTSDGVARWSGTSLTYFTTAEGLSGNWVSSIAQDARGDLWFGTGGGVSRYNGSTFTRYTTKDGLASDQVWCLLLDRSGDIWFGTEEGVSRFNGKSFTPFPIPAVDLSKFPYYKYPRQINAMLQDKAGNIWFATNGGGAYMFDGNSLTNLSEKDGLCNNFVQSMLEDRAGNIWFGTRYGGLCNYNGKAFTSFTRNELNSDHIWTLLQDRAGIIWASADGYGLCSHTGKSFTCYTERDCAALTNVQSLLEDASGQLWIGTSSGVYRFTGGQFTNWTKVDALGG
jgi:ligand-binding sensor domain-containing protein